MTTMSCTAMLRTALLTLALSGTVLAAASAQVPFERLRGAADEPQNWLTYSGGYFSQRYSELEQIAPDNVGDLELQWVYQTPVMGPWQTTPIVVDGVMYLTQRPNDIVALDARTGRVYWIYRHPTSPDHLACCGANNRGVAVLGDKVFMATLDAHVVAIDATTGAELWRVEVADMRLAYAFTLAPLAVDGKVIVGSTGGDQGIRGFIAALDAETGEEVWRFYTIPGPGEPGHETWEPCPPNPETYCDPEAWKHGGAAAWLTGSYDPELNLIYWGTGNPGPDYNRAQRPGDNLYSCSVVALDADTGELRWHFQFTPADPYDFDSVQIPVLADITRNNVEFKVMLCANRNGFYYVLDRATGRFLTGLPFVSAELGRRARRRRAPRRDAAAARRADLSGAPGRDQLVLARLQSADGAVLRPGLGGLRVGVSRACRRSTSRAARSRAGPWRASRAPTARCPTHRSCPSRGAPINDWTDESGHGAILAMDALTGEQRWKFELTDVITSGILTTGSELLFTGLRSGYFQAHDAGTGDMLWKASLGGQITNGPMTYEVDGRQYVAVISGHSLSTFALRD